MTYDVVVVTVATGLFALAFWGRRHVEELVPTRLTPSGRRRELRKYRRGAIVCQAVAILMVIYAVGRLWRGV
jgi:hypothetical protein